MILRKLVVIACFCSSAMMLSAQTKPMYYNARWKVVDSLIEKKGLTESAMEEVKRIYALAVKEHNEPQSIKALIYRISITNQKQENAETAGLKELDSAVAAARQPARSILQSLSAEAYWHYFQRHRWQLYDRTRTMNFVKTDVDTWGVDDLNERIGSLYLSSLQEEKLLKETRLEEYEPIIHKGNVRRLRPTLFDLLAHRALDYFMSNDRNVNKPADVFEIDDPAAFADAAVFAHHVFRTTDTVSLHHKALLLYQRLISEHIADASPDALIDVDIARLGFVHANAIMDNKDSLYKQALARVTDRYGNEPTAAQAWYLQAEQLVFPIGREGAGDSSRYDNARAKAICEKVITQKDSSEGKENCKQLLKQILQKWLTIQTETCYLPGEPLRSMVDWSNFDRLYLRLISLNDYKGMLPAITAWEDKYWNDLLSMPVYREWSQVLPATTDYRRHSAEIAIGSLPAGVYALAGCADKSWSKGSIVAVKYVYVSTIAYVNKDRDYFVVNRQSGQPLEGAKVQVWSQKYNSSDGKVRLEKAESYASDKQGHFILQKNQSDHTYYQRSLEITTSNDHLFIRDGNIPYDNSNWQDQAVGQEASIEARHVQVFLFLDRQIYRPGQTVYFKGIAVTKDKETRQSKVLADWPTKVVLYNANGERVDSLDVRTNEYGSYHGTFRLPTGQLNGEFRVADMAKEGDGQSFSVEEYKRPRFYVAYERQTGSYRVGDSIRVSGNAKAFAGNVLDGATVKYRIVRKARFPYPWLTWRIGWPVRSEQEIKHGEIKTDVKGAFQLVFAAVPDRTISRSLEPQFDYEVTADLTDINGETRSGATTVVAGYTALTLSLELAGGDHQSADSLRELRVGSANLAGEPVASKVRITIYPLQAPDRLIRQRLWTRPDRFVLSEKEFLDSFPHDEYRQETQKESWARGEKIWEAVDSTRSGGIVIRIPKGRLSPGWWLVEVVTTDEYGQEVRDRHYAELYDGKTGRPPSPQYNWVIDQGQTVEPGGKARVETGSSAANVYVIRKTEHAGERSTVSPKGDVVWTSGQFGPGSGGEFSTYTLNKGKNVTEISITEQDRGGIGVSDVFVKDNRIYTRQTIVKVPWTNKQLTIRYTSYRDKTLPGSGEKWTVTIGGPNKDKVLSAEVLGAMYDASLDQLVTHNWRVPSLYSVFTGALSWQGGNSFGSGSSEIRMDNDLRPEIPYEKVYDRLFTEGGSLTYGITRALGGRVPGIAIRGAAHEGAVQKEYVNDKPSYAQAGRLNPESRADSAVYNVKGATASKAVEDQIGQQPVQVRKNFNETAFFFPDLRTDSSGNVSFSFTMPEALTSWKWMTLAHTKDLAFGYSEKTVVTQKQLMVQPNVPRFLREGDRMDLAVKVVNLSDSEMTGQMSLQLTDPTTGQTADGWFTNRQPNQYFTVGAGQSAVLSFPLMVPFQYNRPLTYRVVAQARNYSDGEEATLPVVSNRMLVTETLPLNMKGDGTRQFTFDKLSKSGGSETLNNYSLTVEFTANPTWYAVQSLPYLMEYPYECAEQIFNRWYANALASKIVNSSPRLQQVFASWRVQDTAALLSNLQKNQELKTVLLEETPWVLQGKTEEQQKKNIALLFDLSRMSKELSSTLDRLKGAQSPDGGFPWFKGGYNDLYMTQYVLTGIGHLQKLQAIPPSMSGKVAEIVKPALAYVDGQLKRKYEEMKKMEGAAGARPVSAAGAGAVKAGGVKEPLWPGELPVQYLYMRSFFSDYGVSGDVFPAMNYFRKKAQQTWVKRSKYMQGMIALALSRTGDVQTAKDIVKSLRQNAIRDEEKGMYWKGMEGGYYWYEAPIEIQSLLIEAFREIDRDAAVDRDLKTWLLTQKQTHSWSTTKATADACYALLLGGQDWLNAERSVEIRLGEKVVEFGMAGGAGERKIADTVGIGEAGTGYYKKVFDGPFVSPSMGNITVTMRSKAGSGSAGAAGSGAGAAGRDAVGGSPAWGAVYWQYFDMLDRITPPGSSKAPLQLVKKLFIERNTDRGRVLDPVGENGVLKPGDKVIVRIELRADREMEYVHMKDMRAACMEPVNVISQYKWQGGLGYYESTKDASTDFFFSMLPRGTYVFEYPLLAGQAGNFSNGITSVECMYAPEFAYHSEGIRVSVEGAP